jgi:hypothetical protein
MARRNRRVPCEPSIVTRATTLRNWWLRVARPITHASRLQLAALRRATRESMPCTTPRILLCANAVLSAVYST